LWLTELREAAVAYAHHGWPIRPSVRFSCGIGVPLVDDDDAEIMAPKMVLETWTRAPYPILLRCGSRIEAIEVSSFVSRCALDNLRAAGVLGPIVAASFDTDYLLVAAGDASSELVGNDAGWRRLAAGSLLVLPPTAIDEPLHRWRISPAAVGWMLPDSTAVQDELRKTLVSGSTSSQGLVQSGQR
jgi:hypothetical protein